MAEGDKTECRRMLRGNGKEELTNKCGGRVKGRVTERCNGNEGVCKISERMER